MNFEGNQNSSSEEESETLEVIKSKICIVHPSISSSGIFQNVKIVIF